MTKLYGTINRLIRIALENNLITSRDVVYMRNQLLAVFHEDSYVETEPASGDLYTTLDTLMEIAIEKELVEDTLAQRDIFSSKLMNIFIPAPSLVENEFCHLYEKSPAKATDYFYNLSQSSNYIKMDRIRKNEFFHSPSPYGNLDITINLSKPEKDPKDIIKNRTMSTTKYPTCLLCVENEGYLGKYDHPDRSNHRMIALKLGHKDYMLQYSPYLYYNEHCIVLSQKHEPMAITENTFHNLLDFVKLFPHYFIGSNADLPIVGGSILAHDHYQGGKYTFPMHRAKVVDTFKIEAYKNVDCAILYWPLSTISLTSNDPEELASCANYIYEKWKVYSDEEAGILASTDGTRHNTVNPMARMVNGKYVMDIVLRNNRTSDAFPLGIFHPHEECWHIKKENIGLIEVMGLAILPARLQKELEEVKAYILGTGEAVAERHKAWADTLKASYTSDLDIDQYIKDAVGKKFTTVLEHAGVYKTTEEGLKFFKRFTASL